MYKKIILAIATSVALTHSCVYAADIKNTDNTVGRWGIQGVVTAAGGSGNTGVDFIRYEHAYEIGAGISNTFNNSSAKSNDFNISTFVGLRHYITNNTVFAYGLNLSTDFGKSNGQNIKSSFGAGPYVSIEQYLTSHVVVSAWINPYYYNYLKTTNTSTSTNRFLNSGGIGIAYLF